MLSRRSVLRLFALVLGGVWLGPRRSRSTDLLTALLAPDEASAQTISAPATVLSVTSEAAQLELRYEPDPGRFGLVSLVGHGTTWAQFNGAVGDALWIERVQVDGGPPVNIDGSDGLQLVKSSDGSITLVHSDSGLSIGLEYTAETGNAIVHRMTLSNSRSEGVIQVGSAATLTLRLMAGDFTEALGADDSYEGMNIPAEGEPGPTLVGWTAIRRDLPSEYGNHELRNADRNVYPLIRLVTSAGAGIVVAVSTTSGWRISVGREADRRVLRAGEYQSDLRLQPGEAAQLPEVVTIFYRDGAYGAIASLRRYLQSVSAPPPRGWQNTPPVVFNTWFGYGCAIGDNGDDGSELRYAARLAAQAGVEVLVLDAGWYLGNPIPDTPSGQRFRDALVLSGISGDDGQNQGSERPVFDFDKGLGTWIENPAKWQARAGDGGSKAAGLRNFSDYIHGLDVRRPDGGSSGKMRFGLWIEPERFDPDFGGPERVPWSWAMPGAPILDFSRSDVVDGITARIQKVITDYRVDYLKIDANLAVGADAAVGRTGHFWTRWSAGFEKFLSNLREANPDLFLEHCASGLKRFWIGLPRLAHSSWLDDNVTVENVAQILDATDALMLPRQKTVLVTEDLSRYEQDAEDQNGAPTAQAAVQDMRSLIASYWGGDRRNGGTIGFTDRVELWGEEAKLAAREALTTWKKLIRGSA